MDLNRLRRRLFEPRVIPAHPLALDASRHLDERRQRALSRYYLEAGAGGLAVGVHTTQFAIHEAAVGLYPPVIELAAEECRRFVAAGGSAPVLIAGLVGDTRQAVREARLARDTGYDCGLLSLGALAQASTEALIDHVRQVAAEIPLFGFYLQPAVGGRVLDFTFWRRFVEIENVVAIKIAPFNRYFTLDVIRAVAAGGRLNEIALYTGNDDNILADLLTPFRLDSESVDARIVGGLLGQWAVWTRRAVELLDQVTASRNQAAVPADLLRLNAQLTDANAALFDVANAFSGCIAGIHEVLTRQGLLAGPWCLDPREKLSSGQAEEITRVCRAYPQLTDDIFVAEHRDRWLRP